MKYVVDFENHVDIVLAIEFQPLGGLPIKIQAFRSFPHTPSYNFFPNEETSKKELDLDHKIKMEELKSLMRHLVNDIFQRAWMEIEAQVELKNL